MALHKYFPEWVTTMMGDEEEYHKGSYSLHFYSINGDGFMYTLSKDNQTCLGEIIPLDRFVGENADRIAVMNEIRRKVSNIMGEAVITIEEIEAKRAKEPQDGYEYIKNRLDDGNSIAYPTNSGLPMIRVALHQANVQLLRMIEHYEDSKKKWGLILDYMYIQDFWHSNHKEGQYCIEFLKFLLDQCLKGTSLFSAIGIFIPCNSIVDCLLRNRFAICDFNEAEKELILSYEERLAQIPFDETKCKDWESNKHLFFGL